MLSRLQPTKEADTDRSGHAGRGGGLPYKTLFPPGIQLHNPPSFLVEQARFARIHKGNSNNRGRAPETFLAR